MSVGGGSDRGGHPYISFLFRMNFLISCIYRERAHATLSMANNKCYYYLASTKKFRIFP